MKKNLLLAISFFGTISLLNAQDLIVTLTNGNSESFPVEDIRSLKFGAEEMMLYELNGTTNSWDINDIDNYSFDGVANVEETVSVSSDNLTIYPNPSSDKVTIDYASSVSGEINITVLDMNGRQIEQLFQGKHDKQTEIVWSVKESATTGKYLVKITSKNKVITKPVIIQ